MADKPVVEVVAVDAALDALVSPTSSDVYEVVDAYSEKAVTAAAARRALEGGGGGSQPVKVVRFPITFDTANLTAPAAGITVYTPAAGEILLGGSCVIVTVAWDGATPRLRLFSQGEAAGFADLTGVALSAPNTVDGDHRLIAPVIAPVNANTGDNEQFLDTAPLIALVDDGSGGDPGSATGEGEIVLVIVAAT